MHPVAALSEALAKAQDENSRLRELQDVFRRVEADKLREAREAAAAAAAAHGDAMAAAAQRESTLHGELLCSGSPRVVA